MSTGLDCVLHETPDTRQWYYALETYDRRDQYTLTGPFSSEDAAHKHLHENHANPGGYSLDFDTPLAKLVEWYGEPQKPVYQPRYF